jgi:hypothetical protein
MLDVVEAVSSQQLVLAGTNRLMEGSPISVAIAMNARVTAAAFAAASFGSSASSASS